MNIQVNAPRPYLTTSCLGPGLLCFAFVWLCWVLLAFGGLLACRPVFRLVLELGVSSGGLNADLGLSRIFLDRISLNWFEYLHFIFQMKPINNIFSKIQYLILSFMWDLQEASILKSQSAPHVGRRSRPTCSRFP